VAREGLETKLGFYRTVVIFILHYIISERIKLMRQYLYAIARAKKRELTLSSKLKSVPAL
jgi:hypothetical protein